MWLSVCNNVRNCKGGWDEENCGPVGSAIPLDFTAAHVIIILILLLLIMLGNRAVNEPSRSFTLPEEGLLKVPTRLSKLRQACKQVRQASQFHIIVEMSV